MKPAGVDGCKSGWVVASLHDGSKSLAVTIRLTNTLQQVPDVGFQVISEAILTWPPSRRHKILESEGAAAMAGAGVGGHDGRRHSGFGHEGDLS